MAYYLNQLLGLAEKKESSQTISREDLLHMVAELYAERAIAAKYRVLGFQYLHLIARANPEAGSGIDPEDSYTFKDLQEMASEGLKQF